MINHFQAKYFRFMKLLILKNKLIESNNPYLTTETLVIISTPKSIDKEWRLFIIDNEVISACRYTMDGKLNIDESDLPSQMIDFAINCCREYTPAKIFVMDVALYKNEYKIVECNCFNDSGFYKHDIGKIIKNVNKYLMKI